MRTTPALLALAVGALSTGLLPAVAEPVTVNYRMAIAGLPIGSATLALTPNGQSTAIAVSGRAGGPIDLGRMNATAVVAPGSVTAQSRSGSGKDAAEASLASRGNAGDSRFTYEGVTSRGPGRIAMTVAGSRVTALDAAIPDNPKAVRVPVTDAHKAGVVDPLSLVGLLVAPGGTLRPEAICGRRHAVFTGQARIDMAGTPIEDKPPADAAQGLPQGWRALACRVTVTPVSGHRIDKGNAARVRTANLVFARNGGKTVLWSLSVPAIFGSFTLLADKLN
jgi:hypothetical protein